MAGKQPPNPVRPVRALAKSLTAPLAGLEQLLQEADTLLLALTPPLEQLVDFAPFAQLTVSELTGQPASAPSPVRRSGSTLSRSSTAVTAAPSTGPLTVAPANVQPAPTSSDPVTLGQSAPPIFSLSDHKRTAAPPLINTHPPQPGVDRPWPAANPGPDQPDSSAMPGAYPAQALPIADAPHIQTAAGVPPLESEGLLAPSPAPSGMVGAAAPLAAMPLLVTLTSALLATPPPLGVASLAAAPAAAFVPSRPASAVSRDHSSAPVGFAQTDGVISEQREAVPNGPPPALPPSATPIAHPAAIAALQADQADAPFAGWSVAAAPVTPPDAWTLAQLINEVLSAEARRHGVDLS